jgi:hypothetical protein
MNQFTLTDDLTGQELTQTLYRASSPSTQKVAR